VDRVQLTISIKRERPELRKRACELANDNTDREQELFERIIAREILREED
jgi:hypothetical protein